MAQDALIRIKAKVSGQQEIKGLERQFKETESKAKRLKRQFGELGGAGLSVGKSIASAAAAFATFDAAIRQAGQSIQASIERASSTRRLEVLSQGFDDFEVVLGVASRAAEKFNLSQTNAQKSVAQLYARLRPLGVSLSEVESAYAGFNTAAILSGATATESAGALLQLSQALGAGALRGEEFNSVSEQAPAVIRAIGAELDVPVGRLKEMAANGEITADIVLAALQRIEREGADQLAEAMDSPIQKFQTLQNRIEDLRVAFADLALPSLLDFVTDLADETERWTRAFSGLGKIVDDFTKSPAFVQLNNFLTGLQNINKIAQLVGPLGPISSALGRDPILEQLGQFAPEERQAPKPEKPTTPLSQRLGIDLETEEEKKKKRRGKTPEELRLEMLEKVKEQFFRFGLEQENAARKAIDQIQEETAFAQIRLEKGEEFANVTEKINNLVQAGTPFSEAFGLVEAEENVRKLQKAQDEANAKQKAQVQELKSFYESIGSTIESSIGGAIEGLIFNTKSLGESLSDLAKSLSSMFIQFGVKSLLGGIGFADGGVLNQNKIVPFARGGVVNKPTIFPMANGMGLMGEAGPEAIMPLRRGANGRLGVESTGGMGNVVVNVDATGSTVQGDDAQAGQLGRAIGAAVQAELVKQKRPGGLLAS